MARLIERLVETRVLHMVDVGRAIDCLHPWCRRFAPRVKGYVMHDYPDFQPRKRDVLDARRRKSVAGRKGGESNARRYKHPASADTIAPAKPPTRPDPTRPDPKKLEANCTVELALDARSLNGYRADAEAVLAFLNTKTGRTFRPVAANLRLIEARLKSGITVEALRGVVARKAREWGADPKMAQFLRPETLFNATKCESYLGEREVAP